MPYSYSDRGRYWSEPDLGILLRRYCCCVVVADILLPVDDCPPGQNGCTFSANDSKVFGYALSNGWKCWGFDGSLVIGGWGGWYDQLLRRSN